MKEHKKRLSGSSQSSALRIAGLHSFRRHAVWLLPLLLLWHAMLTYGISKPLGVGSLWAAAFTVPAALCVRFFKRTTAVMAVGIAAIAMFTYLVGVLTPASLLYAVEREDLAIYVIPTAPTLMGLWFVWRLVASLRADRIWRESYAVPRTTDPMAMPVRPADAQVFKGWLWPLGIAAGAAVVLHEQPVFKLFLILVFAPLFGLFFADLLARYVTVYTAFRRFERQRGAPHLLPVESTGDGRRGSAHG
jgi:hypothetical protein